MTQPKLTYFDFSGSRGEECRLALAINDVDFVDNRVNLPDWPQMKSDAPYGQMPLLEVDGKPPLAQTNAILTFIGRTYGHHPKDPYEAARHEAVLAAGEEYRAKAGTTGSDDEEEKKRLRQEFAGGYLQSWSASLEKQIEGPFFAGDEIHIADLKIYTIMDALIRGVVDYIDATAFKDFPKLVALHQAVAEHPKVKAWKAKFA